MRRNFSKIRNRVWLYCHLALLGHNRAPLRGFQGQAPDLGPDQFGAMLGAVYPLISPQCINPLNGFDFQASGLIQPVLAGYKRPGNN